MRQIEWIKGLVTAAVIIALQITAAHHPAAADEHRGMKRYRLRIPINRSYMAIYSRFTLLPEGKGFQISTYDDSDDYLQVNNRVYGPYSEIETPVFSHNGDVAFIYKTWRFPDRACYKAGICCTAPLPQSCLLYWGYSGLYPKTLDEMSRNKGMGYSVHIKNRTYGTYPIAGYVRLSRDGKHFMFKYRKNNTLYYNIDGREYANDLKGYRVRSSMEEKHFTRPCDNNMQCGTIRGRNRKIYVLFPDIQFGPFEKVGKVICNGDGSMFGFNCIMHNNHYVFINGRALGPYDRAHPPSFSCSGSSYWFTFYRNDREYIHINGREKGPFKKLQVHFNRNGTAHALVYSKSGKRFINIGGKTWGPYQSSEILPAFNSDGTRYGFINILYSGRLCDPLQAFIQLPDKRLGPFDAAALSFTEDGKRFIGYVKGRDIYVGEI